MQKKYLTLFLVIFIFVGCTHVPIKNVHMNESKLGYEFNTIGDTSKAIAKDNWLVLRDPNNKQKYTDSAAVSQLVEGYNTKQNNVKISEIFIAPKPFTFRQYKSGQEYFNGIKSLKDKQYDIAIDHFKKALRADSTLLYFSDIYYLMALCSYGLNDSVNAIVFFKNFIKYSESIIPSSFCYNEYPNQYNIGQLAEQNINCDSLYSGHFAEKCRGPVLKHYPYYGFMHMVEGKPLLGFILGTQYDPYNDNLDILYWISLTFKKGYKPYFYGEKDLWGCGIEYQVFRRWDNRLGVLVDFKYINQSIDLDDIQKVRLQNFSVETRSGYFLLPRLCFFLGGKYYYWNEDNKYFSKESGYYLWHNNNLYTGVSVYLWEYLALVGKYSRNQKLQVGLNMLGMDLLFNIGDRSGCETTYW